MTSQGVLTLNDVKSFESTNPDSEKLKTDYLESEINEGERISKISIRKRPVPFDKKAPFHIEELFFSVTDLKSRITYANETFIHTTGMIKISRLDHKGNSFYDITFNELIRQIEYAENKMDELVEFIQSNKETGKLLMSYQSSLKDHLNG